MKLVRTIREYIELAGIQVKLSRYFQSFSEQKLILDKIRAIDRNIESAHNQSHILSFILEILSLPDDVEGCIVEAGAYKGASTAKISIFASLKKRRIHVFDSFKGLPENYENHEKSTEGHSIKNWFNKGNFKGTLEEVQTNISRYGVIDQIQFHEGWFNDTIPSFNEKIALAYLDVDLAESTKTCLKYFYPLLSKGGAIVSQDGDFPLVIQIFQDEEFWRKEIGCEKLPHITGVGKKITIIRKPDGD
jgi:O-methyltransferase